MSLNRCQGHVFSEYGKLSEPQKKALLQECSEVPLEELADLFRSAQTRHDLTQSRDNIRPWPETYKLSQKRRWELFDAGLEEISKGRVACILMAGGQGTRLGSKDPKGMFNVGLLSGKSLFQVQAERIRKLCEMAERRFGNKAKIGWYIMTSEATDAATEKFFEDNQFFGLDASQVKFFEQGQYPALLESGKIAMKSGGEIVLSPNGNGGVYEAVARKGLLEEFEKNDVEYVFVYGVDNIAIRICDPSFVGLLKTEGGDCGVKVVPKDYPSERVGVVALRNDLPSVVEYSELDKHTAEKVDPVTGKLLFNTGNICNHLYTLDFLKRACGNYKSLAKHVAHKAIPHYDFAHKQMVEPSKENGFKFEMFVFDVFALAKKLIPMEVVRDEEFLPLKNKDGTADSNPTTCRIGMSNLHQKILRAAGAIIEGDGLCEISPLVSYCGESLEDKVKGKTITLPIHITAESWAKL